VARQPALIIAQRDVGDVPPNASSNVLATYWARS